MTEDELKIAQGELNNRLLAFNEELKVLITKYNLESVGNVPNFILADYVTRSLVRVSMLIKHQNAWLKV